MCVCILRTLQVREGDHLTLVNVFRAYEAARRSPQWCQARQVQSPLRVTPSRSSHSESV